jgi:hypothetical protein
MLTEVANASRNDIIAALHQASAATGSDFQFLLGTAMRESGLKSQAKSSSSSASGLFQFVEQTWLGLVKQNGAKYGLGSYSDAITESADGHYSVTSSASRQAILALRNDPSVAALMEGEYVRQARDTLQSELGRDVCGGELYAAHFLGPESACRLIRMNQSQPETSAASAFPQAASANRSVFFHADGTSKSVREVYDWALKQTNLSGAVAGPISPPRSGANAAWFSGAMPADDQSIEALAALPQSAFAMTPSVIDILGSLDLSTSGHSRPNT